MAVTVLAYVARTSTGDICVEPLAGLSIVTVCTGAMTTEAVVVLPLESFAVTEKFPVLEPAVYRPLFVMVPPVADHVIELLALSDALNCFISPGARLVAEGFTARVATVMFDAAVVIWRVDASSACTSITCDPFDKLTRLSKVLVFC